MTDVTKDAFNGADPAKFDHDADGAPGGSKPKGRAPKLEAQEPAAPAEGNVIVRVLPQGDGKIFTGEEVAGKPAVYAKGDRIETAADIAQALEDRGFVEIL